MADSDILFCTLASSVPERKELDEYEHCRALVESNGLGHFAKSNSEGAARPREMQSDGLAG